MLFAQFWRKEMFRSLAIKLSYKTCYGIAELFKLVPVELGFIHFSNMLQSSKSMQ
jgi:hypothetical protein